MKPTTLSRLRTGDIFIVSVENKLEVLFIDTYDRTEKMYRCVECTEDSGKITKGYGRHRKVRFLEGKTKVFYLEY